MSSVVGSVVGAVRKTINFAARLTLTKRIIILAVFIFISAASLAIVVVQKQSMIKQGTVRHCFVDFDCQSSGNDCVRSVCKNEACSAPVSKPDGTICADKTWNPGTCSNGACNTVPICEYSNTNGDEYPKTCTGFNGPKSDTCDTSASIQYAFCNPSVGCYYGSSVACPTGQFCRIKDNGEPECYMPLASKCTSNTDCSSDENECIWKLCQDGVCLVPTNKADGTVCSGGICASGICKTFLGYVAPTSTPTLTPTSTPAPIASSIPSPTSTPIPTPISASPVTPAQSVSHHTIALAPGPQTYTISGGHHSPNFTQATIDPLVVSVGDTQTMTVKINDTYSITSVEARVETDNGTQTYSLSLVSGTNLDGTWQGSWIVHDTHMTTYRTTFYALDSNNESASDTLSWSDPCTVPGSGTWAVTAICTIGTGSSSTFAGVDGADISLNTGGDVTLIANSTFYFNSGKSIIFNGGSLNKASGASVAKGDLYIDDADGDHYPPVGYTISTTGGTGRVRLSSLCYTCSPALTVDTTGAISGLDASDGNAAIFPGQACSTNSCQYGNQMDGSCPWWPNGTYGCAGLSSYACLNNLCICQIGCGGSCPFVYSWNGAKWNFDHETYPLAVYKSIEFMNFGRLENLKPIDGKLKLQLKEELPEISFTNLFEAYSAQHPNRNSFVMPDLFGKPHTIQNKILPKRCTAKNGDDCLDSIKSSDEKFWTSNLNQNFKNPENYFDWIILDFAKPAGAKNVKINLRVRDTEAVTWAWQDVSNEMGQNYFPLMEWMQGIEYKIPFLNKILTQSLEENWMLSVEIWSGKEWVKSGAIRSGRDKWNDFLVFDDISKIKTDNLKIRLKSTTGFYEVNSVFVDYSQDEAMKVNKLDISSAIKNNKTDVKELLKGINNKYLEMAQGDVVNLELKDDSAVPGWEKDYFVKAKGYYHLRDYTQHQSFFHFLKLHMDVLMPALTQKGFTAKYFMTRYVKSLSSQAGNSGK